MIRQLPRKAILLLPALLALLLTGCAGQQQVAVPKSESVVSGQAEHLETSFENTLAPLEAAGGTVGISVRDHDGEQVFSHNGDRFLMPASVQKLCVAADVLLHFPPGKQLQTLVYTTGPIDSHGTVQGDLVVVGGWDPSLSGRVPYNDWPWVHFRAWAELLAAQGVHSIAGDLVGVGRRFTPGGWELSDLTERYAPVISQLTWNDGLLATLNTPIDIGEGLQRDYYREVVPDRAWWTVDYTRLRTPGSPITGNEPDTALFHNQWLPSLPHRLGGFEEPTRYWHPVPDPRRLSMDALRQALRNARIEGGDSTRVAATAPDRPEDVATIGLVHRSAPIDSLVRAMLVASSNHWAEMLSALVQEHLGTPIDAYDPRWKQTLGALGVDTTGVRRVDACGMARRNHMQPESVTELLTVAWKRWDARWSDLLARPLEPRASLGGRLARFEKRLLLKTGTLSRAYSLAGYILDRDGKPQYSFTIMCNFAPQPYSEQIERIDAFVAAMVEQYDRTGGLQ
ncbi:hypothetical protein GF324_06185 [bacterium]|nr:hypothetical protein [bacterium]